MHERTNMVQINNYLEIGINGNNFEVCTGSGYFEIDLSEDEMRETINNLKFLATFAESMLKKKSK